MLTEEAITDIAQRMNKEVNIPVMTEAQEEKCIRWVINLARPYIPEWFFGFAASAMKGLTAEEMRVHEDILVAELNKLVDLPLTPEPIEAALLRPVVRALLQYAVQGNVMPGV